MRRMDQSRSMNSTDSQSSSAGWVGASDWVPKSSSVETMPLPMISAHQRFTVTRLSNGFCGATSHLAKPRRLRGRSALMSCKIAGVVAVTLAPGFRYSPRCIIKVSRGLSSSTITRVVGGLMAAIFLLVAASSVSVAFSRGFSF